MKCVGYSGNEKTKKVLISLVAGNSRGKGIRDQILGQVQIRVLINVLLNLQLADYAQNWAEDLAINLRFEHRKNDVVGENLYMFYSSNPAVVVTASDACDSWYSEIKKYEFGKEPKNMKAGMSRTAVRQKSIQDVHQYQI